MSHLTKPEFSPLLPLGFHPMTLADVRALCVDTFGLSSTRDQIMSGFETVVSVLVNEGVEGEIWVDGSFTTAKIDPVDVDWVMFVSSDYIATATQQQQAAIDWVATNLKASHSCDSYVEVQYPKHHAVWAHGEYMRAYWLRQFGFSRGLEFKGLALVKVP